jgi:hypothetical protein
VLDSGHVLVSYGEVHYLRPNYTWQLWFDELSHGNWNNTYYDWAWGVSMWLEARRFSVLDTDHIWHLAELSELG